MSDKRPLHKYLFYVSAYALSELCYAVERRLGTAPDPAKMHRNIAGVLMAEWMGVFIREMPDNYWFMSDRDKIFKAFMYGCNPVRVAEAVKAGKRIIPYCFRYKDGIVF